MKEAQKQEKEIELLKQCWKNEIEEYKKINPLCTPLPFENIQNTNWKIKTIWPDNNGITRNAIKINIEIVIIQDIQNKFGQWEKSVFLYFAAIDSKEKIIPKTFAVASNLRQIELKAGTEISLRGQLSPLANLEDFLRIKVITKSEYEKHALI